MTMNKEDSVEYINCDEYHEYAPCKVNPDKAVHESDKRSVQKFEADPVRLPRKLTFGYLAYIPLLFCVISCLVLCAAYFFPPGFAENIRTRGKVNSLQESLENLSHDITKIGNSLNEIKEARSHELSDIEVKKMVSVVRDTVTQLQNNFDVYKKTISEETKKTTKLLVDDAANLQKVSASIRLQDVEVKKTLALLTATFTQLQKNFDTHRIAIAKEIESTTKLLVNDAANLKTVSASIRVEIAGVRAGVDRIMRCRKVKGC